MSSTLSVRDVCERYGVAEQTVLGWIRSGELRALNCSRRPDAKKPRWRITQEALAAFELARAPETTSRRDPVLFRQFRADPLVARWFERLLAGDAADAERHDQTAGAK